MVNWGSPVQTFLPEPDYRKSAELLDRMRLGKQRVEVLQILNVLHELRDGWRTHPAVRMWRGYEAQLCEYGLVVCEVWTNRGYRDSCFEKINQHLEWATAGSYNMERPPWFGDEDFHRSHQSALIRKDEDLYGPMWPGVPNDLPYVWPV